jgi:hypothetical protein
MKQNEPPHTLRENSLVFSFYVLILLLKGKDKCKVVPVAQHNDGVLGEWRYSSTHSLSSALDGVSCQLHAPAALPPGKVPLVPTG